MSGVGASIMELGVMKRFFFVLLSIFAASMVSAQTNYVVSDGDRLQVEVLEDPSLNRTVTVLPGGTFNFPLAGPVVASGRTLPDIEAALRAQLGSNFAAPPNVFVGAVETGPRVRTGGGVRAVEVFLLGEVNNPGAKSIKPGTTMLQFLAQSGGFTRFAATKRIQLRRRAADGTEQLVTYNYRALLNGAALQNDVVLANDDVIIVPERRLFE